MVYLGIFGYVWVYLGKKLHPSSTVPRLTQRITEIQPLLTRYARCRCFQVTC